MMNAFVPRGSQGQLNLRRKRAEKDDPAKNRPTVDSSDEYESKGDAKEEKKTGCAGEEHDVVDYANREEPDTFTTDDEFEDNIKEDKRRP